MNATAPSRAQRTVNAVRLLRALTPKKRRRKVPRKKWPTLIERDYATALRALTLQAITPGMTDIMRAIPQLVDRAKAAQHVDELGATRSDAGEAKAVVDAAYKTMVARLTVRDIAVVANKYAQQVSGHNAKQLGRQLEAFFGVAVAVPSNGVPAKIDASIDHTVSLVLDNVERFVGKVEKGIMLVLASSRLDAAPSRPAPGPRLTQAIPQPIRIAQSLPAVANARLIVNRPADFDAQALAAAVERNVFLGGSTEELADELQDMFDFTADHAEAIARDQVGKLNGQVDAERQQGLGLMRFTWTTVGDENVRDDHDERNGEVYSYDDPPDGELPGEPINCRCSADPVFDDLVEEE